MKALKVLLEMKTDMTKILSSSLTRTRKQSQTLLLTLNLHPQSSASNLLQAAYPLNPQSLTQSPDLIVARQVVRSARHL